MKREAVQRAWIFFQLRRYEQALSAAKAAVSEYPHDPEPYFLQSLSYSNLNRIEPAREAARQALSLGPNHPYSHHAMGYTWLQEVSVLAYGRDCRLNLNLLPYPRMRIAINHYREAIRLDPEWCMAWSCYAQIRLLNLEFVESEKAARQTLRLDPGFEWGYISLAESLREQWKLDEAEQTCVTGLFDNPESSILLASLGLCHLERGNTEKAVEQFKESLRLDATYPRAKGGLRMAEKTNSSPYRLWLRYKWWRAERRFRQSHG